MEKVNASTDEKATADADARQAGPGPAPRADPAAAAEDPAARAHAAAGEIGLPPLAYKDKLAGPPGVGMSTTFDESLGENPDSSILDLGGRSTHMPPPIARDDAEAAATATDLETGIPRDAARCAPDASAERSFKRIKDIVAAAQLDYKREQEHRRERAAALDVRCAPDASAEQIFKRIEDICAAAHLDYKRARERERAAALDAVPGAAGIKEAVAEVAAVASPYTASWVPSMFIQGPCDACIATGEPCPHDHIFTARAIAGLVESYNIVRQALDGDSDPLVPRATPPALAAALQLPDADAIIVSIVPASAAAYTEMSAVAMVAKRGAVPTYTVMLLGSEKCLCPDHAEAFARDIVRRIRAVDKYGSVPIVAAIAATSNDSDYLVTGILTSSTDINMRGPAIIMDDFDAGGKRLDGVAMTADASKAMSSRALLAIERGRASVCPGVIAASTAHADSPKTANQLVIELVGQLCHYRIDRETGSGIGGGMAVSLAMCMHFLEVFCTSDRRDYVEFMHAFERELWSAPAPDGPDAAQRAPAAAVAAAPVSAAAESDGDAVETIVLGSPCVACRETAEPWMCAHRGVEAVHRPADARLVALYEAAKAEAADIGIPMPPRRMHDRAFSMRAIGGFALSYEDVRLALRHAVAQRNPSEELTAALTAAVQPPDADAIIISVVPAVPVWTYGHLEMAIAATAVKQGDFPTHSVILLGSEICQSTGHVASFASAAVQKIRAIDKYARTPVVVAIQNATTDTATFAEEIAKADVRIGGGRIVVMDERSAGDGCSFGLTETAEASKQMVSRALSAIDGPHGLLASVCPGVSAVSTEYTGSPKTAHQLVVMLVGQLCDYRIDRETGSGFGGGMAVSFMMCLHYMAEFCASDRRDYSEFNRLFQRTPEVAPVAGAPAACSAVPTLVAASEAKTASSDSIGLPCAACLLAGKAPWIRARTDKGVHKVVGEQDDPERASVCSLLVRADGTPVLMHNDPTKVADWLRQSIGYPGRGIVLHTSGDAGPGYIAVSGESQGDASLSPNGWAVAFMRSFGIPAIWSAPRGPVCILACTHRHRAHDVCDLFRWARVEAEPFGIPVHSGMLSITFHDGGSAAK